MASHLPVVFILHLLAFGLVGAKVYERCELARELRDKHEIPQSQLATWVCIAKYESHFNTSAINHGSGDHGIFQISDIYWCSPPGDGFACGLPCSALEDDDIEDDVICARRIYRQHQRLSGNGFTAWVVYNLYCNDPSRVGAHIEGCFGKHDLTDNEIIPSPPPIPSTTTKLETPSTPTPSTTTELKAPSPPTLLIPTSQAPIRKEIKPTEKPTSRLLNRFGDSSVQFPKINLKVIETPEYSAPKLKTPNEVFGTYKPLFPTRRPSAPVTSSEELDQKEAIQKPKGFFTPGNIYAIIDKFDGYSFTMSSNGFVLRKNP